MSPCRSQFKSLPHPLERISRPEMLSSAPAPGGATILTRIDHVTIGVADLKAGIAAYRRIGFDVDERGVARNDGDHLELVRPGDGLQSIAIASDDLAADSKAVGAPGNTDYVKLVGKSSAQPASRHPNGVQRIER